MAAGALRGERLVAGEPLIGGQFGNADPAAELAEVPEPLQHREAEEATVTGAVEPDQRVVGVTFAPAGLVCHGSPLTRAALTATPDAQTPTPSSEMSTTRA